MSFGSQPQYVPHYTLVDYERWEGEWELWSGIPVAMTPSPFGKHQALAARVIQRLRNELDGIGSACEVLHEIDWVIRDDMVVRPDVLLLGGGVPERYVTEPPFLIAEVLSPSTAEKDCGAKFELYQQHGVAWYLILDPDESTEQIFSLRGSGEYQRWPSAERPTITLPDQRQFQLPPFTGSVKAEER
jgi:Uma2 family endonuclease